MPYIFAQFYIHIILAVKGKQSLICMDYREELYKHISEFVNNRKNKLIGIGGVSDHIHILLRISPNVIISDLIKEIKLHSTEFINKSRNVPDKFYWQEGSGCFSSSQSQQENDIKYIKNQEEYHKEHSFKEEYIEFLKNYEIEYDEKDLFEWIE
jgi:putative transposase